MLTNTGQKSVTMTAIKASSSEFSLSGFNLPVDLAAGQSVELNVSFAPTAIGWIGGNVTFTSNASNPSLQLGVAGSGVSTDPLTAAPSSLSFGQVSVGSSSTLAVVLTNARSWKETLTGFQTTGSSFSVTGPTFPVVLNGGQSVTLNVIFAPQAAGETGGSVFIIGPALNIPLTGIGSTIGQLSIAPASLNFGNVDVGNTTSQATTLSATGASVTVSSAASSNSQFEISGASFPLTISAGQSASFNVVFSPTKSGTDSGTLTFTSNASEPQTTESLTGVGVNPQYSVDLSWSPSTSQVVGYNVYRGTTVGSYSKINTSLDPNTTYTDSTVSSGATYYYAATAVNSSGEESSYSTPLEVTIP